MILDIRAQVQYDPTKETCCKFIAPKFNVGDRVQVSENAKQYYYGWSSGYNKYFGTVKGMEGTSTLYKSEKQTTFAAKQPDWKYCIIDENGKRHSNVSEINIVSAPPKPDTSKYFEFLDKRGIKLDRNNYTLVSSKMWADISETHFMWSGGYNIYTMHFEIRLKDLKGAVVYFEGTTDSLNKLPNFGEEC